MQSVVIQGTEVMVMTKNEEKRLKNFERLMRKLYRPKKLGESFKKGNHLKRGGQN